MSQLASILSLGLLQNTLRTATPVVICALGCLLTDHVGMMLVHNGVVRGWSRKDHAPVSSITVSHDQAKMDAICHEMEQRPGIFAIVAQANGGELQPGDDLLLLVVAGDIRENVKATFAELLDRIKSEAVIKQEHGPEA